MKGSSPWELEIKREYFSDGDTRKIIDTRAFKPGVYILTLFNNEKAVKSVKFTIVHQ